MNIATPNANQFTPFIVGNVDIRQVIDTYHPTDIRSVVDFDMRRFRRLVTLVWGGYSSYLVKSSNILARQHETHLTGGNKQDRVGTMMWIAYYAQAFASIPQRTDLGFSILTHNVAFYRLICELAVQEISEKIYGPDLKHRRKSRIWYALNGGPQSNQWPSGSPGIYDYLMCISLTLTDNSSIIQCRN